ncbi:MAG: pentapeptide repeat-containing protein [Candidatus Binatus sp.]|uniref:pentapeptide repeat-containing protein n=1 Tax=Candidatus Binatus sp. TaxID=2811406 RepID=UPI003BAEBF28
MFIERKAIAAAVAIVLLMFAAPASFAAEAHRDESDTAGPSPAATLEMMAQQKFGPALTAAERKLMHAAPMRDVPWFGPSDDPDNASNDTAQGDKWGAERTVRAEVVAWLLGDAQASQYIHPSGLALAGARITGNLDLSYATVSKQLTLIRCYVPEGINLLSAHLQDITVRRSRIGAVFGNMANIHGDATFIMGDFGPVSFLRARIDGTLDLTGARILDAGEDSVNLVEANVAGDVLFHDGFTTDGIVYARLAKIGHDFSVHGAEFRGDGELDAERSTIDGTFYWVDVKHTAKTALDLEDAHAGAIWDDEASWPAPGNLMLNGFVYGDIAGGPSDGDSRLRWLGRQPAEYHPQPYRQLAKVLSEMGRDDGATQVRIAKEIAQRRLGHESLTQRIWSLMLQYTIGFGYVPLRALWWIAGFVGLGAILFGWGYRMRIITPTEEAAYREFVATGEAPPHYPVFNPVVYSLENFLPVVELHQDKYWRPNPRHSVSGRTTRSGEPRDPSSIPSRLLRWYLWLHILAGWTITPLLFAGLSGLVRPD